VLLDFVVILHVVIGAGCAVVATELPFAGQLVVDDLVITIAIADVDDLVRVVFRLVVEHRAAGTRAVFLGVPVVVGSGAPVAVEAELVVQSHWRYVGLCVGTVGRQDARQLNLTILEVQRLAHGYALTLEAVVFDPAAGQAQGQLVLVADTVGAAEAVVAEQRCIAERVLAGVEDRDIALVLVRDVQVERTRFEGLAIVFAEPVGVAIEVQAAVDAGHRNRTVLGALEGAARILGAGRRRRRLRCDDVVLAGAVQIKIVLGIDVLELRRHEAVGPVHRVLNGRRYVQTGTVCTGQAGDIGVQTTLGIAVLIYEVAFFQAAFEPNGFGLVAEVKTTWMERKLTIEGDLRQPVIRCDLGDRCQLISLDVQTRLERVAAIAHRTLLVDVVTTLDAVLVGLEVLEVVRIADLRVVDLGQYTRIQPALVLPVEHVACFFVIGLQLAFVIVVVQVRAAELAFAGLGEVAEFAFHHHAALGHVLRVQRGVIVGRQVEVVRRNQGKAGFAAGAEARRQEAGLTTVVDREIDVRGIQDRDVLDPQRRVGGRTEAGGRVQRDVVALELPGIAVWLAGGVRTVLETDDRVFGTLGVQRVTADTRLVQHVFGVIDLRRTGVQLNLGTVADDQRAVVAHAHIAVQLAPVLGLVQAGFVGLQLHAALAHDDVTGQGGNLLFLLITRGLGTDEGGRIALVRLVVHARTSRLDVRTAAVRAGFGQLGCGQLVARHPVQVAVVGTARTQATALGFGDQCGLRFGRSAAASVGLRRTGGRADGGAVMHRARWQWGSGGFRRAIPGTRSRD